MKLCLNQSPLYTIQTDVIVNALYIVVVFPSPIDCNSVFCQCIFTDHTKNELFLTNRSFNPHS